ncbi:MAG: alkaline phosphatase family protein [Planctomycetota bacterium]
MKPYEKVVVLGMDGLDPAILEMLRQEGAVPGFERLWSEGTGGRLQTVAPAQSPVVWSTLATGTNPGKHGIFDFIHRDPERPLPYLSICRSTGAGLLRSARYVRARRNAALWDVCSERGIPVTVLRWPVTFPAEEINGRMLSGLGVPGIGGTLGHYTFYTDSPSAAPGVPAERLVRVEWADGRAESVVKGPQVRGLTKTTESTAPLTMRRTEEGIALEVAGQSVALAPGEWSKWVPVSFSVGALKRAGGMVKFHLASRDPALRLYMTPVEQDPRYPPFAISAPAGYAAELAEEIGLYHTLGMPEDTKGFDQGAIGADAFQHQCNEITRERLAMFWHEFARFEGGVFAFVFDTSDRIQHMFWRENEVDEELKVLKLCAPIREHYLEMDRFLGQLLDAMEPGTALVLISDHGFTSYHTSLDLNAWLVSEGLMTLREEPEGKTEDETALYKLVDWSKTLAYGCGFSSLYFNLEGREGNGIVKPGQRDELARRIADLMASLQDPKTGRRPVARISRREDIYGGPHLAEAPDMVLGTSPGYRMSWQTAVGGVGPDVLSPNRKHWSGDHIVEPSSVPGAILTNAPLNVAEAGAEDIAPTMLALLGLEVPEECDGRSLLREGTA